MLWVVVFIGYFCLEPVIYTAISLYKAIQNGRNVYFITDESSFQQVLKLSGEIRKNTSQSLIGRSIISNQCQTVIVYWNCIKTYLQIIFVCYFQNVIKSDQTILLLHLCSSLEGCTLPILAYIHFNCTFSLSWIVVSLLIIPLRIILIYG